MEKKDIIITMDDNLDDIEDGIVDKNIPNHTKTSKLIKLFQHRNEIMTRNNFIIHNKGNTFLPVINLVNWIIYTVTAQGRLIIQIL